MGIEDDWECGRTKRRDSTMLEIAVFHNGAADLPIVMTGAGVVITKGGNALGAGAAMSGAARLGAGSASGAAGDGLRIGGSATDASCTGIGATRAGCTAAGVSAGLGGIGASG